ncbi:MAG: RsmB/NOP family class I SAM-dependent RNA methyltransferase, partial [Candidatus Heimdallarchaeota archaeon]|nr:RsmB/NOP family class I SAM-dependent RNA methyltransferase [Candidatus Heimdallarchaeota archaeon]
ITPKRLRDLLTPKGFKLSPTEWVDYGFDVDTSESRLSLGATHEYLKGYYYLQSLGSMVPVQMLYPEPEDRVVDMCAAPGSKTTQIGQFMKQQGTLVAVDVKPSRMKALTSNIRRCGITNAITFPADATQLKEPFKSIFKPNKILLDAPCSGSGIIRVDPTLKRMKNDANIKRLTRIQKHLLKTGLELLEPGGLLLYSTCSFFYQENEQVVAETMQLPTMNNIEIVEPAEDIGLPGFDHVGNLEFGYELLKTRRLFPNIHDTDAFFYCLLRKN